MTKFNPATKLAAVARSEFGKPMPHDKFTAKLHLAVSTAFAVATGSDPDFGHVPQPVKSLFAMYGQLMFDCYMRTVNRNEGATHEVIQTKFCEELDRNLTAFEKMCDPDASEADREAATKDIVEHEVALATGALH